MKRFKRLLAILLTLILAAPCGLAESPSPNGAGPEAVLAEAFDLSEDTAEAGATPAGPEAVTFELSELAAALAGPDTDAPAAEVGAVPAKLEGDATDEAITAATLEDDVPEAGELSLGDEDDAPATDGTPAVDNVPAVDNAPAVDDVPATDDVPTVDNAPAVDDTPAADTADDAADKPADAADGMADKSADGADDEANIPVDAPVDAPANLLDDIPAEEYDDAPVGTPLEASADAADDVADVPADAADDTAAEAVLPIPVTFETVPEGAAVTVRAAGDDEHGEPAESVESQGEAPGEPDETDESGESGASDEAVETEESGEAGEIGESSDAAGDAIPAEADGSYLLMPGEYVYSATAAGYVPVENARFTVADEPLTIRVALSPVAQAAPEDAGDDAHDKVSDDAQNDTQNDAQDDEQAQADARDDAQADAEAAPFEQSVLYDGVVVTVKAEAGVFPADAELSVTRVLLYEQRQADAAVEALRGENQSVAASYTFDIKVLDAQGRELQPAEGRAVSVSFSAEAVADENLTPGVYHIPEEGAAGKAGGDGGGRGHRHGGDGGLLHLHGGIYL